MDIRHDPILQHKTPTQPFNLRRQKEVSGLKLKFLPDSRYTLPQGLRRHLEPCGEAVRKRCYPPGSTFRNNSVGNVTYVNAWANPPSVPVCLTNRFFHQNLSRNGVWISLSHSNQSRCVPGINISQWQQIIAQNGSRPRHFAITQPYLPPNSFMNTYGVILAVQQSSSATKAFISSIDLFEISPHTTWQCIRKAPHTANHPQEDCE